MANSFSSAQHKISLGRAKQMTKLYREQKDLILKPEFAGRGILAISETINRAAVERLLAQPDCVAVRFYYAMDEQLQVKIILVGVNSRDEDMLHLSSGSSGTISALSTTTDGGTASTSEGEILDEAQRCPPNCPPPSELNP